MAEKVAVGYLPGNDPESAMANMAYQQALERMQSALDARKNRFFDPTMLAIAEGLLGPGSGPTFGGAIGNVAGKLRESQALQEKEEREIAQAQLGLAGRGIEVERLRQRDREFERAIGGEGALPSGAEAGPQGALPGPIQTGVAQGVQIGPPNPRYLSGQQYLRFARGEPSIPITTALKEAQKLDTDRIEVRDKYIYDRASGLGYYPTAEVVEIQIYGYPGTYKVSGRDAVELQLYASQGSPKYHELAARIIGGPPTQIPTPPKAGETKAEPKVEPKAEAKPGEAPSAAPTAPGAVPGAAPGAAPTGPKPTRLMSKEELAALAAGAEEEAKLEAKRTIGEKTEYLDNGRTVTPRLATISMLYPIASGKNADKIFGVFERPTVAAAFAKLIEGGVGTRSFAISMPALRAALTQAGIPQTLINQAQMAYSLMAQVQLEASRIASGQGQVSNFERELFAQASIAATDNPAVILAKLDMLKARANLDKARAEMVRKHRGNLDDLVLSDEWSNLTTNYLNEINGIFDSRLAGAPVSKNAQPNYPAVPGRDNKGAQERLPEKVK